MAMSSGLINLLRRQFPGVDDPASSANDLLKDVIIQGDQREQLEQDKKLLEEADDIGADEITREARRDQRQARRAASSGPSKLTRPLRGRRRSMPSEASSPASSCSKPMGQVAKNLWSFPLSVMRDTLRPFGGARPRSSSHTIIGAWTGVGCAARRIPATSHN